MIHADALTIASDLAIMLAPTCLRPPLVAGSIRRCKPEVKDCEILVLLDPKPPVPEFGRPLYRTSLDKLLAMMVNEEGRLRRVKGGQVYQQYEILMHHYGMMAVNPFYLDLFIVTDPATWGVQAVIRTGPAEFSKWCVTSTARGGGLPAGARFDEKNPWHVTLEDGKVIPMPEEIDFLNYLGLGWIEPEARQPKWRWNDRRS